MNDQLNNQPNKQEKINENLLSDMLKNCEPFILPGTIQAHCNNLLTMNDKIDTNDLISFLNTLGKLRTQLDQEPTRRDKKEFLTIKESLTKIANKINSLVSYNLIAEPELVLTFRYQLYILHKNIKQSEFEESSIKRVLNEVNTYVANKATATYKQQNYFLQGLTRKLRKVNGSFVSSKNIIPFSENLEKEFDIKFY